MAFEDLVELVEPLELPIRGKVYTLPKPSLEDGIKLRSLLDGGATPNVTNADVLRILLGDVDAEMTADGVSDEWRGRALLTALSDFRHGRFAAEILWRTGGDPKEIEALKDRMLNRAQRRAKKSTSTGEAGTTKRQASTSGTKMSRKR